jgi:hypothetical protein
VNQTVGYYPRFELPDWFDGPAMLRELLRELWNHRYPELYDSEGDAPVAELTPGLERLVEALGTDGADGHRRLLWLGLILARASRDTVSGHAAEDIRPEIAQQAAQAALAGKLADVPNADELFPPVVTPPQALQEALDVDRQLVRALDPAAAPQALVDALDDSLQGYAIVPGAAGRRDLFNWLLVEAAPAAWEQRLPDAIYTAKWPWPPTSHAPPLERS